MTTAVNPGQAGASASGALQASSVLVVDDEPDLLTLYELTLLREGLEVETASSVAQAREVLQSRVFRAVISDMRLPDGTGLDLLKWLEASGRPEKVIVVTAYGSPENAVTALKAGAFDYLTKPVDLRQFRAVVASAMGRTSRDVAAAAVPRRRPKRGRPTASRRSAAPAGGRVGGHEPRARPGREGGAQHGAGAGAGRVGHRQGTRRARHPRRQRACRPALRGRQLWRDSRDAARVRVLRRAQGRVHRRQRRPRRLLPGGQRRHAVPRRDRRPAVRDAVQAAARDPGTRGARGRRSQRPSRR